MAVWRDQGPISKMDFIEKLNHAWEKSGSLVCVGLDPIPDRLPASCRGSDTPFLTFNRSIVEATCEHACAYKPQFAHYASANRLGELRETIRFIRERAPHAVVILDAKRGDIGSTAERYAEEAFAVYEADAVTVNPYMGGDTLAPFTGDSRRGIFVLCKTSNPGSAELQDLMLEKGHRLYEEVARRASEAWNERGNVGLVVGATYPAELARVRRLAPDLPFLVPGIGAQGGDLEATLKAGVRPDGGGILINSSRGILYASNGEDFAEAAGKAALGIKDACREILATLKESSGV